jgi:thioredoxin 1
MYSLDIMDKTSFKDLLNNNSDVIIIKFTATWCAPCKRALPMINEYKNNLPETYQFIEVDIDESLDIYGTLKSKRIVSGIPSLVAYYKDNTSLWPDEAISSSDPTDIKAFFNTVVNQG